MSPPNASTTRTTRTTRTIRSGRTGRRFDPAQVGWRLGADHEPRGNELWVPWDRTTGVIGPQGCGKTLDLLTPALLDAPGAALVTLTKTDDLLLSLTSRARRGPCLVLDPFGQAPGVPELVWDPIAGCVDPLTAERRAKAFCAGTIRGALSQGQHDAAARFYAAEAAKVLQGFFHAAALTGRTLDQLLQWVAKPRKATEPAEILRTHPHAARFWVGLLDGALRGDDRTAANTVTTVQQAMNLFFQEQIRARCVPTTTGPDTSTGTGTGIGNSADIRSVIAAGGTIYLLGRDDPYAPASPLMTALAEHVLDTALAMANESPWGRLCPPMAAVLDELPSTAPLPTLATRMANERALGIGFIYAAQTYRQLTAIYGADEAQTLFGLTNVAVIFGGSKDVTFNRELSDLVGQTRVPRMTWQTGRLTGWSAGGEDIDVIRPEEIRHLPQRRALVIAENGRPIIARLSRCIDGPHGAQLQAEHAHWRHRLSAARTHTENPNARTARAHAASRQLGLTNEQHTHPHNAPHEPPGPGIVDTPTTTPSFSGWTT